MTELEAARPDTAVSESVTEVAVRVPDSGQSVSDVIRHNGQWSTPATRLTRSRRLGVSEGTPLTKT